MNRPAPPLPLFSLQGIRFGYRNQPVLEGIDLVLEAGKFYALIGANGSGKSTLLELLLSTLTPDSGTLRFQEQPLEHYSCKDLARHLALVPQHFSLDFDYAVRDVVLMGRHPHIARFASATAHDLALVDQAMKVMDILQLSDRPITALSGGELQRVVMARALAQDTEVLILDEATSSLDIQHSIEIMRVMRQRVSQEGRTVIAAIHDLNLAAAFCDECLVLQGGRLVAQGPAQEIFCRELIQEVFSVDCQTDPQGSHPRIQFQYL